jgi:hypothetical protein
MRRFIGWTLLLTLVLGAPAASHDDRWGDGPRETLIARFTANGVITAAQCAAVDFSLGSGGCTGETQVFYPTEGFIVTRVGASVATAPWTTTEACDVAVHIADTEQASTLFEVGGITSGCPGSPQCAAFELDATGDSAQLTGLSVSISAGDKITVEHNTPANTTNCNNGVSCACSGTNSYQYYIWGVRTP